MSSAALAPTVRSGPARATIVTLLLASSLTIMAGATISPSLPAIESHFHYAWHADMLTRLVLTLPAIMIVFSAPIAGRLSDRYGRRPVIVASAILYGFAGMSGLVADSLVGLLIGRALLGIAVAGIMTTSTALAGDYFAGPARDRFIGLQVASNGFGGLAFLLAGGLLADQHWRAPFAIYGLAFLLLPAIIAFIGAKASEFAAATPKVAQALPQAKAPFPLWALCLIAFLNFVSFYLLPTQLPYYMRELGLVGSTLSGLAIGLSPLFGAITSLLFGRLKQRFGTAGLFVLGFLMMSSGHLALGLAPNYAVVLAGVIVSGLGMGIVMPNFSTAALALATPATRGRVAGLLSSAIFSGQFLSPVFSQPLQLAYGYAAVFMLSSGLLLFVAVAIGLLRMRPTAARVVLQD
jgi:MFS family permease